MSAVAIVGRKMCTAGCGTALTGRQRDYCSDRCRKRVERAAGEPIKYPRQITESAREQLCAKHGLIFLEFQHQFRSPNQVSASIWVTNHGCPRCDVERITQPMIDMEMRRTEGERQKAISEALQERIATQEYEQALEAEVKRQLPDLRAKLAQDLQAKTRSEIFQRFDLNCRQALFEQFVEQSPDLRAKWEAGNEATNGKN